MAVYYNRPVFQPKTAIYELAENVYRGFTLDEIDNQFLMHPFGGFRFEGVLSVNQPCNI